VDNRPDYKRANIGGDEVEQEAKFREPFQILLEFNVNYHELTQEQTDRSRQKAEYETRPSPGGDAFASCQTRNQSYSKIKNRICL